MPDDQHEWCDCDACEDRCPACGCALARDSDVSIVTINAMARNRTRQVHLDTIDKLCKALGVEPGALFVVEKRRGK